MRLIEIAARSFRNLSPDPVFFGAGVTLITGENAQGKTNLLEAVAVLCGQRSFRRVRPQEMAAGRGETGFSIAGTLRRGGEKETLRVEWSPGAGRTFTRGEKAVSFREASRLAPAVFLSPEHRELLTGGPALRRRFVDRLALLSRPAAGEDLASFEKALAERNALLARGARGRTADDERRAANDERDTWTEELVRSGAAVRRHRRAALAERKTHFEPLAADAGTEYSAIEIAYISDGETEEDLRAECRRVLPAELRRGHSLAGPHRDDIRFARHGRPLAVQASAGELHRTAALVKLAEWRAIREATGEPPLLGVDEFDAGLSAAWADAFVESLPRADGGTILLTSAGDPSRWRALVGSVVEMRAGRAVSRPRAVNEE